MGKILSLSLSIYIYIYTHTQLLQPTLNITPIDFASRISAHANSLNNVPPPFTQLQAPHTAQVSGVKSERGPGHQTVKKGKGNGQNGKGQDKQGRGQGIGGKGKGQYQERGQQREQQQPQQQGHAGGSGSKLMNGPAGNGLSKREQKREGAAGD